MSLLWEKRIPSHRHHQEVASQTGLRSPNAESVGMNSIPNQTVLPNRITATDCETGKQFEITDPQFIQKLIDLGFKEGRNNTPEDLARILKNVPEKHRQAFMDGYNGKLLNAKPQ